MNSTGIRYGVKDKNYDAYWENRVEKKRTVKTPIHHRIEELVIKKIRKSGNILDLGVGPGQVFKSLQDLGYNMFGVEISDKAFALYDFPHESIKKADLEKEIPNFANEKFDLIIASHILHHFDNPVAFLESVKQKMSEQTILLVATPNTTFINHRLRYLLLGEFPNLSRAHINFLTPTDYTKLFKQHGFKIIEKTGIKHYPFFSINIPSVFSPTLFYSVKKA